MKIPQLSPIGAENLVNNEGCLPLLYYPEIDNKPHNSKNGLKGSQVAPYNNEEAPRHTIADLRDPAPTPAPYVIPSWMLEPDRIEVLEPEYEILIDYTKKEGDRLSIQEIIKKLPAPKKSPLQDQKDRASIVTLCASGFLRGECSGSETHRFARIMLCNKEWCPDCGRKNSFAHKQRIARWWDKILQMKTLGYMVITIPEEIRDKFKDKKILSEFRTYIKRKLQREGYSRGFSRYHYAGDCEECKGKGAEVGCLFCENTGSSKVWKPHLNLLIEGKYISPEDFARWRNDLKNYFNSRFKTEISPEFEANIYYNYGKTAGYKIHKLKYVTRATWRFSDNYEFGDIIQTIKGFRTSSSWGKFKKMDLPRTSPLIHFVNNQCPCCKEPIKWSGFSSMSDYFMGKFNLFHIEGGYYKYQKVGADPPPRIDIPPPPLLDKIELKEKIFIYKPIEIPF